MSECACWEMVELVEVMSAAYVGECNLEVEYSCPCCSGGYVRTATVDVDLAPDAALLLLSAADRAALVRDMRAAGDEDPYRSLLDGALQALRARCYGSAGDALDAATLGWIERGSADVVARRLRALVQDHTAYQLTLERAARCIEAARDGLGSVDAEVESKARAEREALEAAFEAFERRAA